MSVFNVSVRTPLDSPQNRETADQDLKCTLVSFTISRVWYVCVLKPL